MNAIPAETVFFADECTPGLVEKPSEETVRIEVTFPLIYEVIPESFERALQDVNGGRVVDLEQALNEPAPKI